MKIKSLLIGMLACTALVGCNNDDVIDNVTPDKDGLKTFAVNVSINFGNDMSTRALTGEYDDGAETEWGVTNATVAFYSSSKSFLGKAVVPASSFNQYTADGTNGNITSKATVIFQAAEKPVYAIALLNHTSDNDATTSDIESTILVDGKGIADLEQACNDPLVTEDNKFFMINTTYVDDNGKVKKEVEVGNNIVEVTDETDLNTALNGKSVTIYVERVAAKVTLNLNGITNEKVENETLGTIYKLKYVNINNGNDNNQNNDNVETPSDFGIVITDWALSGTNKSFYPIKQLQPNYTDFESLETAPHVWNVAKDHRSHWAEDTNYDDTNYPIAATWESLTSATYPDTYALTYKTLSAIENDTYTDIKKPQYCYENTYKQTATKAEELNLPAVTYVVLVAQYVDLSSTTPKVLSNDYVYRIGQVVWTSANLKADIANLLVNNYNVYNGDSKVTTSSELVNQITITVPVGGTISFANNHTVSEITLANGYTVKKADNTTVVNNILAEYMGPDAKIYAYKDGKCVYTIPVEHFGEAGSAKFNNLDLGYWGVVRNHWYEMAITNIAGFGDPAPEGEPIIPDPNPLKTWAVNNEINVVAWSKVSQSTEIGSGNEWN